MPILLRVGLLPPHGKESTSPFTLRILTTMNVDSSNNLHHLDAKSMLRSVPQIMDLPLACDQLSQFLCIEEYANCVMKMQLKTRHTLWWSVPPTTALEIQCPSIF